MLLNLLDNAINAAPPATTIDVHGEPCADGGFLIRVANRGPVIAPALLPAMFERYRRGPTRGHRRGWGLGLTFGGTRAAAQSPPTPLCGRRAPSGALW